MSTVLVILIVTSSGAHVSKCNNLTEILKYLKHVKLKIFIIVILTRSTIPVGEATNKCIFCTTEKL
jgi:hypothetical protein